MMVLPIAKIYDTMIMDVMWLFVCSNICVVWFA